MLSSKKEESSVAARSDVVRCCCGVDGREGGENPLTERLGNSKMEVQRSLCVGVRTLIFQDVCLRWFEDGRVGLEDESA